MPSASASSVQRRTCATSSSTIRCLARVRSGLNGGPFALPRLPMTPGREVAGVVDAVGAEVDEDWLGRRVVAHLGMASGGYAELAAEDVVLVTAAAGGIGNLLVQAARNLGATVVGGRIILFGWSSGEPTRIDANDLYAGGLTASAAVGPRMLNRPSGLRTLEERSLAAAASKELVPLVGQTFPLARAADAHTALETRATTGKVVLKP